MMIKHNKISQLPVETMIRSRMEKGYFCVRSNLHYNPVRSRPAVTKKLLATCSELESRIGTQKQAW